MIFRATNLFGYVGFIFCCILIYKYKLSTWNWYYIWKYNITVEPISLVRSDKNECESILSGASFGLIRSALLLQIVFSQCNLHFAILRYFLSQNDALLLQSFNGQRIRDQSNNRAQHMVEHLHKRSFSHRTITVIYTKLYQVSKYSMPYLRASPRASIFVICSLFFSFAKSTLFPSKILIGIAHFSISVIHSSAFSNVDRRVESNKIIATVEPTQYLVASLRFVGLPQMSKKANLYA